MSNRRYRPDALRALFVNENIGGHRTLHANLATAISERDDVGATFVDAAVPGPARRVVGARIPGLARLDLDLKPLRHQLAASLLMRRRLRPMLREADVLHVYSHNMAVAFPDLLRSRPSVIGTDCTNIQNAVTLSYRDPTRFTALSLRVGRPFEQRVYDSATLVVAQSDYAARSLRHDYGVEDDRLRVVRYGIVLPPASQAVETERPEITFVGTSMRGKGGWELVEAHQRELRERAILNLVTHDTVPALEGVRVFNDIQPGDGRLQEILARTTVFAFPSRIDKSSFAVVEALAAGVPALVCRVGAQPELVEDGVSGLVVEPDDGRALVTALTTLVDDPVLARRMGAAARARAENLFDAHRTTAQLVDVLQEAARRFQPR